MRTSLLLIIATLAWTSALAQTSDTRRRIYPTQDGFLEVDPRSGAISECKRAEDGYRCERIGHGDALLKEDSPPQAQTPAPPAAPKPERRLIGPSDEEIDRALDVMERFLRRFMGILREERGERT
jgi:hypothetical protein